MLGEESLSLVEPQITPEHEAALSTPHHNAPDFKNKMAREVLKAITMTPPKNEQIPSLLVATSFGGEFEVDDGSSPHNDKGVKELRRKFEDNEADIITELYARHFKNKPDGTNTQKSVTERHYDVNQGGMLNSSEGGFEAPADSIEELGFNTDIDDDVTQQQH